MSLWRAMRHENAALAYALGQGDPAGNALLGSNALPLDAAGTGPAAGAVGGYGTQRASPYVDVRVRGGASTPSTGGGGSGGGGGGSGGGGPYIPTQIA